MLQCKRKHEKLFTLVFTLVISYVVIKYKHSPCSHSGPTLHSPKSICYMNP